MYVKSQTVRKPNGKSYTYYRLVHAFREEGKVKHRVVAELGALTADEAEKLSRRFAQIAGKDAASMAEAELVGLSFFGGPLLVEHLVDELGLGKCVARALASRRVEFDVVAALKVMICAHLFKSGSRSEHAVWDWQQKLFWHPHRVADLAYHQLLRALAFFVDVKDEVEKQVFLRTRNLFNLSVDLVFYDLTSSFVEGQAAGSKLRQRGYSRDGRPDCKQIVIGLVVTREGFPVTCRVFDGNTVDKATLGEMVKDLKKRFDVQRCIWVSDAGLLTDSNRKMLEESGYDYILGAGNGSTKAVQAAIDQTRRGPECVVKQVRLWDVPAPEGGRRMVVIESDGRREKTTAILERKLAKVREGLKDVERQVGESKLKTAKAIEAAAGRVVNRSGVSRHFSFTAKEQGLEWREDTDAVAARKADAGKYALVTSTKLKAEEVLGAYRTLLAAEDAFRVLKDELDLRPLWHQSDGNIEGHVMVAMWSYLVHRTLEARLEGAGVSLSPARALAAVGEVQAVEVADRDEAIWKLVRVGPDAEKVFQAVGIENAKERFAQWAKGAPTYHYEDRHATPPPGDELPCEPAGIPESA